ncbi:hypothetical protein PIB30_081350 [Stylosanthes scabra]|uniref:Uncharacterized protein n=1 Tax=Stylosanthes scabra TaxID=79078 RepID=A0ABU6WPY8_9FABA|nr:hypothetical protein [Stylosanthes scabra]
MDQVTILSAFQRDIEEIKIVALKSEKAIEEENSQNQSTPLIVEEILIPKPVKEECHQNNKMEDLLDNDLLNALGDLPHLNDTFNCVDCDGVTLCSVCVDIEVCFKGDNVHETNIFNGDKNIPDEVKNVSDVGHLEKNDDCEVENNLVVEVEELRSMKPSKFSIDLNENFDSFMVCVNSIVRDCTQSPIDKKNEKGEIIVDYVQSVPSSTSNIQLPPKSQLELALENSDVYKVKNDSQDKHGVQTTYGFQQHLMIGAYLELEISFQAQTTAI